MSQESNRFGKYRLLQRIGAGGMGEVHLAKLKGPSGFEKLVVIKRLLQHRRDEQRFVDMFYSEARVTAQLNHSNIVQIYEVDNFEDVPYIAMEYVRGKSLRHILDTVRRRGGPKSGRNRKLPCLAAHYIVQIFSELCQGLAFAHDARHMSGATLGLIHRDINPHNVLLTYRGEVKLIDFGIAKSELTLDQTQAGTIKGTVIYMSPEQSAGKKLDRRSDMFAVGVCLYEILAGHNPFHKDNMAASLEAVRQAKVPPLDMSNPEVAPFAPIVYRALAKDPDDRYPDCEVMGEALTKLLQDGIVPRLEVSLGDFLQRLYVDAIDEEDRLLSQTEIVDAADLEALVQTRKPQELGGAKTVAFGQGLPQAIESDLHTVADTPYGAPLSDELSGLGAPVQLPDAQHIDNRPTQNLAAIDSSLSGAAGPRIAAAALAPGADEAATLGHFDLGSLGGASAPRIRTSAKTRFKDAVHRTGSDDFDAPSARAARPTAPKSTEALSHTDQADQAAQEADTDTHQMQSGFWDISWRRLQFLRAPTAFWARLPPGERVTVSVLASVVTLAWLCVGLAYISQGPETVHAQDPVAFLGAANDAAAHPNAEAKQAALQPAPGPPPQVEPHPAAAIARGGASEPVAYNEEMHIDAMADPTVTPAPDAAVFPSDAPARARTPAHRPLPPRRRPQPGKLQRGDSDGGVTNAGPSLLVGMDPAVPLSKDGALQQRNIKTRNQPGTLQFEPMMQAGAPVTFGIKVHYRMTPKGMLYSIESEPWANVFGAGGLSLGRTPIHDMLGSTTTVLEFRNPHIDSHQRISLHVTGD